METIGEIDIRGYVLTSRRRCEEILCAECVTSEDRENFKDGQVLTEGRLLEEDSVYFCDHCKKQI